MHTLTIVLAIIWVLATAAAVYLRRRYNSFLYRDLLVIGGYGLLTLGFFWQLALVPNTFVPIGGGDLASFMYPVYSFSAQSWQQGIIPFWNPHLYSGSPFFADMQSGVLYPINLLVFAIERPFSYQTIEWLAVIHYFLGAVFTYLYCRRLDMSRPSAFGSGVVFAFCGFTVAHLGHLNMLAAAVWLPLILFFFHRAVTNASLISAVGAGAIYGVSILAGHTYMSLYFALFLGLYWIWSLVGRARAREASSSMTGIVLCLPLTGVVAAATTVVQLLPTLELFGSSIRSEITYAGAAEFSASPMGLITLLVPHFFGRSAADYWGIEWNLTEVYGYVGIMTLVMAALGLLLSRRASNWRWFFSMTAILFLLFSLGEYTVLHGWLYKFVPGFDKVRSAGRFLFLFDFSIAILAGFGLEILFRPLKMRERPPYQFFLWGMGLVLAGSIFVAGPFFYHALLISQDKDPAIFKHTADSIQSINMALLFFAASFGLLMLYRFKPRARALLPYFAVALLIIDIFSANAGYNPTSEDVTEGHKHPEVVSFFRGDTSLFRVDSATNVWDVWQPDLTLIYGINDVMGIFNPMMLDRYDVYWANLGSRSVPAYDLLNSKYVIGHKDVVLDWSKFKPVLTDAPKVNVYQNTKVLPRALIVPRAETLSDKDMLARLRSKDFDPGQTLFLKEGTKIAPTTPAQDFSYKILSVEYPNPNEVMVKAVCNHPGYLLLSEVHYPGWRVYVDGRRSQVLCGNYIFRAVALPQGEHEVHLVFRPRFWEVIAAVSLFSWLMVLAVGAYTIVRGLAKSPKTRQRPR